MKVYIFSGPNNVFGYTSDDTGANLPSASGPWALFKTIEMTDGETGRIGVNSADALADINRQGYHLTRTVVQATRSTGNA